MLPSGETITFNYAIEDKDRSDGCAYDGVWHGLEITSPEGESGFYNFYFYGG